MVLYYGAADRATSATINLRLNPMISKLSLVDVTLRVDEFASHHRHSAHKQAGIHAIPRAKWKLGEFWAMHIHLLPELQKFRYLWRLAPRSVLLGDITTNLYEVMQAKEIAIGYRLLKHSKPESCQGLPKATQKFYESNTQWAPESIATRYFLDMYQEAKCPLWSPDFLIVDIDYLRSKSGYKPYLQYIVDQGGFSQRGWGEHVVQTLFMGTQEGPERTLCMTPWVPSFAGQSKTECGDEMSLNSFFQKGVKEYLSQPLSPPVDVFAKLQKRTATRVFQEANRIRFVGQDKASHRGVGTLKDLVSRHGVTIGAGLLICWLVFVYMRTVKSRK
jgi:hypothetical protein